MGKSERKISSRRPALVVRPLLAALAAAGLAMPIAAPAATIQVTTGGDAGGAACTLRQAIESINLASLQGTCAFTGLDPFGTNDTVDLTLRSGTITLGGTEIAITKPVTLNGPVAGPSVLTISGNNASRVFSVTDAASSLTINRLTIANGKAAGSGGCILGGTLESSTTVIDVTESIVTSCVAMPTSPADTFETVGVGGGIAGGGVILTRSTISGNTAVAGGGVFAKYLRAAGSSISNNTAAGSTCDQGTGPNNYCFLTVFGGGGVFAGSMYAQSSTISGNTVNPSSITNTDAPPTTSILGIGGGVTAFGYGPAPLSPLGAARAGSSTLAGTSALAGMVERAAPAVQAAKAAVAAKTGSAARTARVAAAAQITIPPGKYGAVLVNTTVSGNSVAASGAGSEKKYLGGGVFSLGIFASNSTVSGNSVTASGYGSGLFTTNMTLNNSTIAGNTGIGGIVLAGSSDSNFVLRSTLVANNTGPGKDIECPGSCTVTGDTSLVRVPGDGVTLPSGTIVGKDPLLGPLANNGGPVAGAPGDAGTAVIKTILPQNGSPVVDQGSNPDSLAFDQRGPGFPRTLGAAPDIGAIEAGGSAGSTAVPMLGAWPLAALSALLGVLGWRARRRSG